ncbi:unnamed protein product [Urochloa decumbens]|uniref:NB-ARC domain-containing protein n=1 Tax=Urochloa decumbens TaxID=240449 RepID=A0ABC9FMQ9_9POAL
MLSKALFIILSSTSWAIFLRREFLMEIFVSAILGELASRSINFFISKSSKPKVLDMDQGLQRALLRAQLIINEATGRHITNPAMLQQVDMLRDAMHHGCYVLDTFRYQSHSEENGKDQAVSHSLSLSSKVIFLKGIYSSNRNTLLLQQLEDALDNLSSMILDMKELVVFLMSYPHMYQQPYNMHLLLGNCMFSRQIETELVVNFLLDTQHRYHGSEELEVLPIVGPAKVGKSTLVAHVCKNERVQDHFSKILFLRDQDFTDGDLAKLREGCAMKHQNCISNSNKDKGWLVIVDLLGDLNGDAWNVLYSSCKQLMPSTSKIVIANRSAKITEFGTTRALHMKYLSPEASWYFFKTIAFGSMDPNKMHPRFAQVAMEIAKLLDRGLIGVNIIACLLRDNFDIRFWCKVLDFLRRLVQKYVSKFGVHPTVLMYQNKPVHIGRMTNPFEDLVLYREYQRFSHEEVPKIRVDDVVYGSVEALGKSEFLAWDSRIPPYYSYVFTCEVRELKHRAAKRKRSTENGTTLC